MASALSPNGEGSYRLAVDVGGTFIDYVLLDEETGQVSVDKEPAYKDTINTQLFAGYDRVLANRAGVARLIHGSTLAINTILQEAGARVGLITTRGFRDVLEIGRGNRTDIYDFFWEPPRPLVPRRLRREVSERLTATGEVLTPLDGDELDEQVRFLIDAGIDALAICFLHSYANPVHEREARERILETFPSLLVTASHEVASEWREYERTSSVVLNAYLMPILSRYFGQVEEGLAERSFDGDLAIMQSNGGVMPTSVARDVPIRTLESGPAGGVVGARALAEATGESNVICADVGGTSFDVALINEGRVVERYKTEIERRPVLAPTTDIASIGAGGGSIAWIDDRNSVRVGPMSAGARPGPACFGLGGDRPTVTDCNVVLGRLDPDNFLGRRMKLDVRAAEAAVESVAEPLGMDIAEAAGGIIRLAETNMAYAIRQMTVERGYDPRRFSLLAYGGGGGLFASALIDDLEIPRAFVPAAAAVFSAWGLLFADYREDASLTRVFPVTAKSREDFRQLLDGVVHAASEKLGLHGIDTTDAVLTARADVRFAGQEHTLTVPVKLGKDAASMVEELRRDFAERHLAQYGQADISRDIEVVTLRATAIGHVSHPSLRRPGRDAARPSPRSARDVWFGAQQEFVEAEIWRREDLPPDIEIEGPAVVEEWNTTIIIAPEQTARVDEFGSIVLA